MPISFVEAIEIIENGRSEEYLDRFIGAVKFAAVTGNSAAISLDDALVASMALTKLLQTSDGRKLIGRPKGKNTKYKAKDFRLNSPQRKVVIEFLSGRLEEETALKKFIETFAGSDDERTLKRIFEELVEDQKEFARGCAAMLMAAGADNCIAGSQKAAGDEIMENLGGIHWRQISK